MAATWMWRDKLGTITFDYGRGKSTHNLYTGGNCLAVMLYEYKENGKEMYSFNGFWEDVKHLKRCLDGGIYEEAVKVKLNAYYKDAAKVAELFAKHTGAKVELFYKEPKKPKQ